MSNPNDGIMNKIGGGLRAAHGMGETLRGKINDTFEQGAGAVAGRTNTGTNPTRADYTASTGANGVGTGAGTYGANTTTTGAGAGSNNNAYPGSGSGAGAAPTRGATIAQKGLAEMHEGFDRMAGRDKASSMANAGTHNLPPGASATSQPPQLPPRPNQNLNAAGTGPGYAQDEVGGSAQVGMNDGSMGQQLQPEYAQGNPQTGRGSF